MKTARSRPVRAPGRVRFRPAQRDAGRARNDQSLRNLEAAGFRPEFDLLGRTQLVVEEIGALETETEERRDRRRSFVAPVRD